MASLNSDWLLYSSDHCLELTNPFETPVRLAPPVSNGFGMPLLMRMPKIKENDMNVLIAGLIGFAIGFVFGAIAIGMMAAAANGDRHLEGGPE